MKISYKNNLVVLLIAIGLIVIFYSFYQTNNKVDPQSSNLDNNQATVPAGSQAFLQDGLSTNTSISSIPLPKILDGGPPKDGIPAINNPLFTSIEDRDERIDMNNTGVIVESTAFNKFYPYAILDWHEIVNDTIDGTNIAVTFCPLCGSAVAFNRDLNDEMLQFGVSGKLWESNLLMYDTATESLWSQIAGEAVVGEMTGKKLDIYPSNIMSLKEAISEYGESSIQVLGTDTGYDRPYGQSPYGNYLETDEIYFPISVNDERLPLKELMYIINTDSKSVAFRKSELQKQRVVKVETGDEILTVQIKTPTNIIVTDQTGREYAGYHALWFSWAQHHQDDGILWKQ